MGSRPDKFALIPTGGKSFMVASTSHTGGALPPMSEKLKAKPKAAAAGKPSALAAVKEIQAQLKKQGGTGHVWVDNWKQRFGALADSPREFMESRSEFEVIPGDGNKFSVSIAGKNGGGGTKRKLPWE